jgi:hypothetical protein
VGILFKPDDFFYGAKTYFLLFIRTCLSPCPSSASKGILIKYLFLFFIFLFSVGRIEFGQTWLVVEGNLGRDGSYTVSFYSFTTNVIFSLHHL